MTRVIWSLAALVDVEHHRRRLATFSSLADRRFSARIDAAVLRLGDFPESGHVVREFGELGFREVTVAPYRVLYLWDGVEVEIVAVVHRAMDLTERGQTTNE